MADQEPAIRPVRADDYEAWKLLWHDYNAFYRRHGATALPEQVTRTTWSRFFADDEPMHALVAEEDTRIVGIVHYLFHRSTTQIEPTCYLQDLFTVEDARGHGVGEALIEAVCRQARIEGSPRVYWQTHETNATAQRLYDRVAERSGFIVYRKPC
jgi:GNAT superfamily N-acetyltransferase